MKRSKVVPLMTAIESPVESKDCAAVALQGALERVVARAPRALDEFYEATVDDVWRVAAALLSPADAEEVVEDVYLYVWHNAERYQRTRGSVLGWLTTLCRSRAIDRWRALQRRRSVEGSRSVEHSHSVMRSHSMESARAGAEPGGDASDMPQHASNSEAEPQGTIALAGGPSLLRESRLAEALLMLSEPQRQAITLAYFRGFTHHEIAGHLDMPLGTVKTHLRRALDALREALIG